MSNSKQWTRRWAVLVCLTASLLLTLLVTALPTRAGGAFQARNAANEGWYTAFARPMTPLLAVPINTVSNQTIRTVVRVVAGGDAVRVQVSNVGGAYQTKGVTPLTVGAAAVGLAAEQGAVVPGSNRPLTFGGQPSITIPGGAMTVSDPVPFSVAPEQDLAVSLFISSLSTPADSSSYIGAVSYLTAMGSGNRVMDQGAGAFTETAARTYLVAAVDVQNVAQNGTIMALGSSSFAGNGSEGPFNGMVDVLARRFQTELPAKQRKTVVNAGIAGEQVLQAPARLDRDVFKATNLTHVLLYEGQNDITFGRASADMVIGRIQAVIDAVHAKGVKIVVSTLNPNDAWTTDQNETKRQVNAWILGGGNCSGKCDVSIDFDRVVRDPANPDKYFPPFNSGDGTHPSNAGHAAVARSVDLCIFSLCSAAQPTSAPTVTATLAPPTPTLPPAATATPSSAPQVRLYLPLVIR